MIIAVIDTTLAVAKRKPEKNVQDSNPWTVVILVISMQIKTGNTLGVGGGGTAIYGPYRYLLL